MGKIVRNGVEFAGASNSAENIKYDGTTSMKDAIDELNGELTVGYNEETDCIKIYYNGEWHDVLSANLQAYYLFKNGIGLQNNTSVVISKASDLSLDFGSSITITDTVISVTRNTANGWSIVTFQNDLSEFLGKGKSIYIDVGISSDITNLDTVFQPNNYYFVNADNGIVLKDNFTSRMFVELPIDTYASATNKYLSIGGCPSDLSIFNVYIK